MKYTLITKGNNEVEVVYVCFSNITSEVCF